MMNAMAFGDRLKDAMDLRNTTQGMLEARTTQLGRKVTQGYISRLLKNSQDPTLDVARVLAVALKVSLDWLAELPRSDAAQTDEEELLQNYRRILDPRIKRFILNAVRDAQRPLDR